MKRLAILLLATTMLGTACRKASESTPGEVNFWGSFYQESDSINKGSVKYLMFNYCEKNEVINDSQLNDPDFFTHSIKIEIDNALKSNIGINSGSISLPGDQEYYIKKFDFIDQDSNVVYYTPFGDFYKFVDGVKYTCPGLPLRFKVISGHQSSMSIDIIMK